MGIDIIATLVLLTGIFIVIIITVERSVPKAEKTKAILKRKHSVRSAWYGADTNGSGVGDSGSGGDGDC